MKFHVALPFASIAMICVAAPAFGAVTIPDENWVSMNAIAGTSGEVDALLYSDSTLYIGGRFTMAGTANAKYVASWNGKGWSSLGWGMNNWVDALAIDSMGGLYAGGSFDSADGKVALRIARWDGQSWNPLGIGLNGEVKAIAVAPNGNVYVGGLFTTAVTTKPGIAASHIAMWDGKAWSAVGGGLNDNVWSLAFDAEGNLIVGGEFTKAGATEVRHIARWDGSTWTPVGQGVNGTALAIVRGLDGRMFVGGAFDSAGSIRASRVAVWEGNSWSAMGSGFNESVWSLSTDGKGNLYAGGTFTATESNSMAYIAKWDGTTWKSLGDGARERVMAMASAPGGKLFVGATVAIKFGYTDRLSIWDGAAWSPLEPVLDGAISSLAIDKEGKLLAAGHFPLMGLGNVLKRDGGAWASMGFVSYETVGSMVPNGKGGFFVSGVFRDKDTTLNGVPATKWDYFLEGSENAWTHIHGSMQMSPQIRAMALDSSRRLVVVGTIEFASDSSVPSKLGSNIARWDGTSWSTFGTGANETVFAVAVGHDGQLYAGGGFDSIGGKAIVACARWDGTEWFQLGKGFKDIDWVHTMAVARNGDLLIGGIIRSLSGGDVLVARWNGVDWEQLGQGLSEGDVRTLLVAPNGDIYAGGSFKQIGGVLANNIARWDGSTWSPLGSGTNGQVLSMAMVGGDLYVGGGFMKAGEKISPYLAKVRVEGTVGTDERSSGAKVGQPRMVPVSHGFFAEGLRGPARMVDVDGSIVWSGNLARDGFQAVTVPRGLHFFQCGAFQRSFLVR